MGTSRFPHESEKLAKEFAKRMKKPIEAYPNLQLSGSYEDLISDDDFTDALYEDAGKFFLKPSTRYESFDIRPVLKERMTYFMIDEELQYLLTGTFLNKGTTLKAVNTVRTAVGLQPLKPITKQQIADYNDRLIPEKTEDDHIRHSILIKHPERLQALFFRKK